MKFNKKKYLNSLGKQSFAFSIDPFSLNSHKHDVNKKTNPSQLKKIAVPDWFINKKQVDVSIIVPLYRSSAEIRDQISNWHFDKKYKSEIIYINDACPEESCKHVIQEWSKQKPTSVGKLLFNETNQGYGFSCNKGANVALGKYLIFLNADCVTTSGWISGLIDPLQDKKIGIVGNLQLKNKNIIDSCGSSWSWQTNDFRHIGRSIYKGSLLKTPYTFENCPKDLLQIQERDMVTGCCFSIRSDLFYDLNGFDLNYKIGYWEDADLCLRVKTDGYKIIYQPNSIVYHSGNHSGAVHHAHKQKNRIFFIKRWIETQRIDGLIKNKRPSIKKKQKPSMVGCIIACNEEEFIEAAVDSLSNVIDKWIIVVGGNEYAHKAGMCDKKGYPNDSTLEISRNLVKKYGGVVIEPPNRLWKDKVEMRNQYASRLKENEWMFMLDGDEVYKQNQLCRIQELIDQQYECFILNFWTFWNNVNTIGTGIWDNYPQERIVKWKKNYRYSGSNHLHVSNGLGLVRSKVKTFQNKERLFYHYSWVRPLHKIKQKRDYYKYQSGRNGDEYLEKIFLEWRKNPEKINGNTHPFGGGGAEAFKGVHPIQIQKLIEQNKLNF
jgi:GT2 family glycosyltransferase